MENLSEFDAGDIYIVEKVFKFGRMCPQPEGVPIQNFKSFWQLIYGSARTFAIVRARRTYLWWIESKQKMVCFVKD